MLGIGGPELSERHAVDTARLLSRIHPACVRIRTFVPNSGTAMGDDYLAGRFTLMPAKDILRELRLLVLHITTPMYLLSEHWSDFIMFEANLPAEKAALLELIDKALELPEEAFRPLAICHERD